MKTFLTTTFAILLFTVTCKAQWTTSGTNIYNSNTGNVGIGTTAPAAGKLVIDANTAAPSIVLHILNSAGGSGNNGAITFGGSGSTAGAYGFIDYNPASGAGIRHSALGPLVFGTNTNAGYGSSTFTETMRITPSGNVGIGTTSPASSLQVVGDARLGTNGTYTDLRMFTDGVVGGYNQINSISPVTVPGSGTAKAALYLKSKIATGTTRMDLLVDGYVGIGTTTPDQALTVNGTVHSKAVVVDNSIFPDYVFNKTYALRPLSAVKTYIDINHHLPEMPSAAEVAKNGQNLGEINALLLKKVEELTLYMIEQDKKGKVAQELIQKQQTELSTQKLSAQAQEERINKLEKQLQAMAEKLK